MCSNGLGGWGSGSLVGGSGGATTDASPGQDPKPYASYNPTATVNAVQVPSLVRKNEG